MSKIQKCELCQNGDFSKLFNKNGIDVLVCKKCGLVFANFHISDNGQIDFSKNIYSEKYFTGAQSNTIWGNVGYEKNYFKDKKDEKFRIAQRNLDEIEKIGAKKGKLLDIGCAAGFFLKVARDMGWETFGIELSEFAVRYAQEEFGLNVNAGTVETSKFPEGYFDVITAWDVIEHIPSPQAFIIETSRLLKKNGLLVLGTPNVESLATKIRKGNWYHFKPPEHLFYFGPKTLEKLMCPYFKNVKVKPVMAPYSKIQISFKQLFKRFVYIPFNTFSAIVHKGEYLKAYAWK